MKIILFISIFLSFIANATEQEPDLLLYKTDKILIYTYPLEMLIEKDSTIYQKLKDTVCLSTACWRNHIGIWKIENDSLFLVGLKDCCYHKSVPLNLIFNENQINNQKIFADWFTGNIKAGFGKYIGFNEEEWEEMYEKTIDLNIENGIVKKLLIIENE